MSTPHELSAAERAACAVCADWLSTGTLWSQAALLAMLGLLLSPPAAHRPGLLAALVLLGAFERVLALRVAFDARLFQRLADGRLTDLPALDNALQHVLSIPAAKTGRPLPPRIAGARRLYRIQVLATLLLVALNVLAWWRG